MHTSASRRDIAKSVGVSESTVSRALSGSPLISNETRRLVEQAAERMGYVPSRQAALFAKRRTYHIGFVIRTYRSFPPFSRAYFPALLDGAVLAAEQRGYWIVVVLDRTEEHKKDLVRIARSREVDGFLFTITERNDERLEALKAQKVPFVLVNEHYPGCCCVDNRPDKGMEKAFAYAVDMGHRRFGYITGDMQYRNARDRLGVLQRLAAQYSIDTAVEYGDFSRTSGYLCSGRMLQRDPRPTLIMTASDRAALGVLDHCREHRTAVPGDVSVIGYDDLDPANDVTPALTTVHNPVTDSGYAASQLLIDRIEGKARRPVVKWLDTDFVIRESSGPCPQKKRGGA